MQMLLCSGGCGREIDGEQYCGDCMVDANRRVAGLQAKLDDLPMLRERLRRTTQILIDEVGADGPMNAEEAAHKAVAVIEAMRAERDDAQRKQLALEALATGIPAKDIAKARGWGHLYGEIRSPEERFEARICVCCEAPFEADVGDGRELCSLCEEETGCRS